MITSCFHDLLDLIFDVIMSLLIYGDFATSEATRTGEKKELNWQLELYKSSHD